MDIIQHKLCDTIIGAPSDMLETCGALPVLTRKDENGTWAISFWKPEPAELAVLLNQGTIALWVRASGRQHPVVSMGVQEPEEGVAPEARVGLDFIEALFIANGVFDQYKVDQYKWWHTMDGTPILNDVAVRMAEAFREATNSTFQSRVQPWMQECFGPTISADKEERNDRFLEESLELVQAGGMSVEAAHQLVDYVFNRPVGEPSQEVGGVMVTLAALCLAHGLDMHQNAETELTRIWTKVEQIRAKQASKPKHSPLPQ